MPTYYTEYPTGIFKRKNDEEALLIPAKVIYKESDTPDGRPFIMLKEKPNDTIHKKGRQS